MYTGLLPKYSLSGASSIGPRAKPKIYMDRPSVATSAETLKCSDMSSAALEYPPAHRQVITLSQLAKQVMYHFLNLGKFLGFSGSFFAKVT